MADSLVPMGGRWQRFVAEVSRYLAVGLVATVVALILFNLLVHGFGTFGAFEAPMNDQPELAYVLANAVGMAISFRGTKAWAFRDRQARHADGGVIAFVVINLVTLVIPIACLMVSRDADGARRPDLGQHLRERGGPADGQHRAVLPLPLRTSSTGRRCRSRLSFGEDEVEEELSGPPTGRSTSDRVPPPAP